MFEAKKEFNELDVEADKIVLPEISEIETTDGWKYGKDLKVFDQLITDEGIVLIDTIYYYPETKEYTLTVRSA